MNQEHIDDILMDIQIQPEPTPQEETEIADETTAETVEYFAKDPNEQTIKSTTRT